MELPRSNASMSAQNARCGSCWVLEPHTRCIPGIPGVYPAWCPAYLLALSSQPAGWPPHCSIHTVFGAGARAVHSCGPQRYRGVGGCAHLYRDNGGVSRTCSMRTCARCPSLRHPHCVWDRGEGCPLLWPSAISWRRGLRAPVPCQCHLLHAHMRTVAVTAFSERPLPLDSAQATRNNGIQVETVATPTCMARHAPPSACLQDCAPATPGLSPRCRGSSPHARQQPGVGS